MIFRVNKTSNYTVISNYHLQEKEMSLKAKGLLSLMLSLPDEWNFSIDGLAQLSKDGRNSIKAGLDELAEHGYLIRTQALNKQGQFSGYDYEVFEKPILKDEGIIFSPYGEKPSTEKPSTEKPSTEKPSTEKLHQLNTNISNTNISNTNI